MATTIDTTDGELLDLQRAVDRRGRSSTVTVDREALRQRRLLEVTAGPDQAGLVH